MRTKGEEGTGTGDEEQPPPVPGDALYVRGHGPALFVEASSTRRGRKKYLVRYPDGTEYHIGLEDILARQSAPAPAVGPAWTPPWSPRASRGAAGAGALPGPPSPQSPRHSMPSIGPRHLEYLSRPFNDDSRNITSPSAIFSLVATMVGGGVLSLPYAMSQCGLALGTGALVVSAAASAWTLDMLVDCARSTGQDKFELVGHAAFGECSRRATMALVFVICWLALVAYYVLIADLLVPVSELVIPSLADVSEDGGGGPISPDNLRRVILAGATVLLGPMCFKSSLHALRFLCFASVASVLFVGVVVFVRAWPAFSGLAHNLVVMHRNGSTTLELLTTEYEMWPSSWVQAVYVFPMFGVSFLCHFNCLPTHQEFARPTRWRMRRVWILAMASTGIIYLFIAISGYIFAGKHTCGNILLNFGSKDTLVAVARVALGCVLMLNFPLICQPARNALYRLISSFQCGSRLLPHSGSAGQFDGSSTNLEGAAAATQPLARAQVHVYHRDHARGRMHRSSPGIEAVDAYVPKDETVQNSGGEPTVLQRSVLTALVLGGSLVIACFLQSVMVVWSILGSTVAFLVGYILPAAFWWKLVGPFSRPCKRRAAATLVGVVSPLAVVCTGLTIVNLGASKCPTFD